MLVRRTSIAAAVLTLGLVSQVGQAEDIDIYASPTSNQDNPNVLIIIDNSANWSSAAQHWPGGVKQGQSELNAVRTVIGELGDGINVGLMMFTEGSGTNKDGGYVRFHVRPMTVGNKAAFSELIGYPSGCTDGNNSLNGTPNCIYKNFDSPSEKVGTAKTDYSAVLFEAFKYFGGYTSPSHAHDNVAGTPVDASHFGALRYSGNPDTKSDPAAYSGDNKLSYNPPLPSSGVSCAKNYIIFIGNGFPTQDSLSSLLSGVGGSTDQLKLPGFTTATTAVTSTLETTACGDYSSVSACQTGASNKYSTAYSSYSCTEASTCAASTPVTTNYNLGTSSCLSTQASCLSNLSSAFPGYDSYSCTAPTACTTSAANPTPLVPVATTACTKISNTSACQTAGAALAPTYSGFTCDATTSTSCSSGNKIYNITATHKTISGNTYTQGGSRTTASGSATTSYTMQGTRSVLTVQANGTTSAPATSDIRYPDEWTQFLYTTDVSAATGQQNVRTYTIDVFKDQQDSRQTALLMNMATAGGGKYFNATDEDAIKNALRRIFNEIQSVSSVFASSSLPVSVNTQGTYLNQIFIGMFRPDGSARPRWAGNLKQYEFKRFGTALNMADKLGNQAMSSTTGFISNCAVSIWSTDTGTYWNYPGSEAVGTCTDTSLKSNFPSPGSPSFYSDAPDGDIVEKGGAAQKLRGARSPGGTLIPSSNRYQECGGNSPLTAECRKLLTCTGTCSSLVEFNASSSGLSTNLANWIRGQDVDDENANGVSEEVRPSVHGGVVHSQPAVVDFGEDTGVVAFYGADDGVLHAVTGRKDDSDGTELWGFVAPETYGRFNRLRDNGNTTDLINLPGIIGSSAPKDYFFDGSIGLYQKSSTTWIFPTMRRGGRAIYAFDVSTPGSPTIKWRKGCFTNSTANDSNCSTGWSSMGQTWSKPQIGYISGYVDSDDQPKPVLIFGGGYDTCEDVNSQTRCTTSPRKGANIWFVDADTGTILRTYPTNYSVPGDVTLITDDSNNIKYVYAADTGGYAYRINVGSISGDSSSFTFNNWTSNTSASAIAIAAMTEANHARKFIFGPEVLEMYGFNLVTLVSGDREHPLKENYPCGDFSATPGEYVGNQFYLFKDELGDQSGSDITPTNLVDITSGNVTAMLFDAATQGWKYDFTSAQRRCEQGVNKPIITGGMVYFGTNQPKSSTQQCVTNLGTARGYQVSLATGGVLTTEYNGGGLPPSPVSGIVQLEDGTRVPFLIGGIDPRGPLEGAKVFVTPPLMRNKLYWFINENR